MSNCAKCKGTRLFSDGHGGIFCRLCGHEKRSAPPAEEAKPEPRMSDLNGIYKPVMFNGLYAATWVREHKFWGIYAYRLDMRGCAVQRSKALLGDLQFEDPDYWRKRGNEHWRVRVGRFSHDEAFMLDDESFPTLESAQAFVDTAIAREDDKR